MTELVVRRLLIDLETPFARHWCGGDAFRSALFNALSMSFPVGEQFFIDAVRDGHKALPPDQQAQFADEVRGFIGQERIPFGDFIANRFGQYFRAQDLNAALPGPSL